jgi:hypothetical protein
VSREHYRAAGSELEVADPPPEGLKLHIASLGDDGKPTIVEVWDERAQAEEFGE